MSSADRAYRLLSSAYQRAAFAFGNGGLLPPYRAQFEITYRCNSFCRHCCKQHTPEDFERLPPDTLTARDWIALAQSLPRFTLITITGGEPMVQPGFAEIVEGISRTHTVNLLSNATLMNDEIVDLLLRVRIVLLGTPIYGTPERHNAIVRAAGHYELTVDNLRRLQSRREAAAVRRPMLDLKTIIDENNLGDVDHLIDLARSLRADFLTFSLGYNNPAMLNPFLKPDLSHPDFQRLHPFGPSEPAARREFAKVFRRLVAQRGAGSTHFRFYPHFPNADLAEKFFLSPDDFAGRLKSCMCPWGTIVVNPEGKVFPCLSVEVGSVCDAPWQRSWRGAKFRDFRRTIRERGTLPACWGCCYIAIDYFQPTRPGREY